MASFLEKISPKWTPHQGQKRFLLNEATTKILACGRRWGKSQACAIQVLYHWLCVRESRQMVIAPTIAQARIVIDSVPDLVEKIAPRFAHRIQLRRGVLRFGSHFLIHGSAAQKNNLRGFEASHLIIDEAAFVPSPFIESVLLPMMATTDG